MNWVGNEEQLKLKSLFLSMLGLFRNTLLQCSQLLCPQGLHPVPFACPLFVDASCTSQPGDIN